MGRSFNASDFAKGKSVSLDEMELRVGWLKVVQSRIFFSNVKKIKPWLIFFPLLV